MEKIFSPQQIEAEIYRQWEQQGCFHVPKLKAPYSMVIPPPNVTGSLHMGHGFQQTLMDVLVRYHRMLGDHTLWVVGTDHAGIATQMVVERHLNAQGENREQLGREKFIERVWDWKKTSGHTITQQMRRLGISVDWSREHFTMDADLSHAVFVAFEKLYDDGLIYRGERLVNWDPVMQTVVSDLEVVVEETEGNIFHLRYPLAEHPQQYLVVATTRPETLFGDAAVAVHPADKRYTALIGKQILHPLTQRCIPIIADNYVDPEFGTGCVKITPGHDFNDYSVGQRHQLPLLNIFTPTAHLNTNVPLAYQGLERFVARQQVLADLSAQGLLDKIVPHKLSIPRNDRSNAILEPFLTKQWYVKMDSLASKAIKAVETGETQFIPDNWRKTYFQWLESIQDWCISRQLWWGHRIPVFYDSQGQVYIAETETQARRKYNLADSVALKQDPDVLDTWFSSALWPFSTLGWPAKTADLATFYPTSVLVTGFDIIFFWVARMLMFGLYFTGKVPFRTVYITGLIRDEKGQKMSKSKGNVVDPVDLIDGIELANLVAKRTAHLMQPQMAANIAQATRRQFPKGIVASGTDALRFTYCALATNGRDIQFDLGRLEGYRNFCNKLWNAARFVLLNTATHTSPATVQLGMPEQWIISCLNLAIAQVRHHFDQYRFDLASQTLYEFIWHDYCDWYLEFSKSQLNDAAFSTLQKASNRKVLLEVLEHALRLLHPLMPFITETIWQQLRPSLDLQASSIMLAEYPIYQPKLVDQVALVQMQRLKNMITSIRNIRGEMNVSPAKTVALLLKHPDPKVQQQISSQENLLRSLAKLDSITWLSSQAAPPPAVTAFVEGIELFIPLAGLVDIPVEKMRLTKAISKLNEAIEQTNSQLNNAGYRAKAPPAVIAKARLLLAEHQAMRLKLTAQLEAL